MDKDKNLLEIRQVIRNPATCQRILAALEDDGVKPTTYVMRLIHDDLKRRDANRVKRTGLLISPTLLAELKILFDENK
jgi:hypothetical protein